MMDQYPEEQEQLLEEWLAQAAPQPDPTFHRRLRAQLAAQLARESERELPKENPTMHSQTRAFPWRLAAAAALLVLIVLLTLTPAGRALAKSILELGAFRFTDDPTIVEEMVAGDRELEGQPVRTQRFQPAEASAEAGFTVLYPSYLPDGYRPEGDPPITLIYQSEGGVKEATAMFTRPGDSHNLISYRQIPYTPQLERDPFEVGIGAAEAITLTVNGDPGVFFKDLAWGTRLDENGEQVAVPYNVMIWIQLFEGEQFEFWLYSGERLPLEELRRVAESMVP